MSTLFVGNVGFKTSESGLREFFADCGDIIDVRIAMNEDGRPRGFAHIQFESEDAAKEAVKKNG